MRSLTAFLRISFFLLIVCLGTDAQAQTAPPSHAHRYPDAVVVKVWTPTGEQWLRLEQTAPGYYHGSIEFESLGWMSSVTEYYEFTCLMTMDVRDSPFRFHHEFRDKDGYDAAPSEFWTELRYDWDLAVFTQPEDFGVYFDDPSPAVQPSSNQASLVGGVGQSQLTLAGQTKVASPVAAGPAGPSASGREEASVDAEGYDSFGFDRSGYDRDGYDAVGYDRRGVDRQGFNRAGVYQGDFDAEGYDSTGYDRDGYDRQGYDHNGRDREGYDYGGFNAAGYSRYGGYLYGYDQAYAQPNADEPVFDARGFAATGLNQNGTYYDDLGYDVLGYDLLGYDVEGYDRNGFDGAGWNRTGRDAEGYDREGRNARGFNRYGIHRNTTLYDEQGFDMQGYNRSGEYFAGYDFNQPTDKAAESKGVITGQGSGQPSGLTAQQQALTELLVAEGFPSGPQVLSDQDIAKLVAQYGSVDKITPAEWEALEKQCLDQSLTLLWYDLDNRIALVELGLSDEDPAALRAKQMQIEEYLLGLASPGASSRDVPEVAGASKVGLVPSVGAAAAILAVPEPVTGWLDSVGQWMADHPRTMGAVRGVGGMAEVIAGSVATATTSGAGAPLAIPLILHGIDQVVAGAAQVVTGEQTHSRLEKIVAATAEAVGVSPQNAEIVGSVVDAVTGLALTAGVGSGPALTRAVAKEVEVGTTAAKVAASGGKVLLAAEDCNAAGLKRLFDSLPKKANTSTPIAYLETETDMLEVWAQLEKTGAKVVETRPGVFRMQLADGTHVIKYGSHSDKTLTLSFNGEGYKKALKIHLQTK
jgi:hypothetical protein